MSMNRGKIALLLAVVLAAVLLSAQAALADKVITLTFTGDCTIGSEEKHRNKKDSFDTYAEEKGYDYFFQNFAGMNIRQSFVSGNL